MLSESDQLLCESEITIEELKDALLIMDNDKSPRNDGNFTGFFWENITNCLSVFKIFYPHLKDKLL